MTQPEFEADLDRWGADLTKWPPQAAARARQRLATDPGARQALTAAATVDGYLQGLRADTAPAHLTQRVLARLDAPGPAAKPWPLLDWLMHRLWRPALVALAPVLMGFLLGQATAAPGEAEVAAQVATLAFSDVYAEFDDVQR